MAMTMRMIGSLCVLATCIAAMIASVSAAGAGSDCSEVVYEMMPCVDYLSVGSTTGKTSKDCCKAVGDVMKTNPECICVALKQSGSIGIQLNLTRALSLPQACLISTPPPHCGIPLPPGMAPTPVPNNKPPSPAPRRAGPMPAPTMVPTSSPRRAGPTSAPTMVPTASVPEVSPSNGPGPSNTPMAAPFGPDSPETAPTPTLSDAPSLTVSFTLIVSLLLTLLVSF